MSSIHGERNAPPHTWFWLGMAPSMLVAVAALLAPTDVLDRLPFMRPGVEWLAGTIPSMSAYLGYSQFSQVTGFTFLLAWAFFPFQFIYMLYSFMRYTNVVELVRRIKAGGHTRTHALLMSGGLSVVAIWALFFLAKDPGIVGSYGVATNRLGLAFFGAFQFWITALCFSVFCVCAFRTRKSDFYLTD